MSTNYGWMIHTDCISEEETGPIDVKIYGPKECPQDLLNKLRAGEGTEFEIYDDDNILYYKGRIIGACYGFEPLDDFGEPNAGATMIKYKNKEGEWEVL